MTVTLFPTSLDLIVMGLRTGGPARRIRFQVFARLLRSPHFLACLPTRTECVSLMAGESEEEGGVALRVTNSTYSGQIYCSDLAAGRTTLSLVLSSFQSAGLPSGYKLSFRSQVFPGMCLRIRTEELRGTVNIFNNGKYVILGVTKEEEAEKLSTQLCAIMRRWWRTFGEGTPCAWSAD